MSAMLWISSTVIVRIDTIVEIRSTSDALVDSYDLIVVTENDRAHRLTFNDANIRDQKLSSIVREINEEAEKHYCRPL